MGIVNVVPILWTIMAVVGVTVSLFNATGAYAVWRQNEFAAPLARKLAFYQFRRSVLRTLTLGTFTVMGVAALLSEPDVTIWAWSALMPAVALLTVGEILERFELLTFRWRNGEAPRPRGE